MDFKLAIVGAGYMAREHLRAFAAIDGCQIVGICSRTNAKAAELASDFGGSVFETIEAMYLETQADIVVVAVPELATLDVCKQIFRFPWISLLEKPVGYNLEQAEEILHLCTTQNRDSYVALNRRSYAATRGASDLLPQAEPRHIIVHDTQDAEEAAAMGQPRQVVANYMFANSIHLVDYFSYFSRGQLAAVDVTLPWNSSRPTTVVATLRYDSGDTGLYVGNWNTPGPWFVTVTTNSIRAELRPLERAGFQRRGERQLTIIEPDLFDSEYKPGLHYQASQIARRLNGESANLATLEEATRSMRLVAKIYGLSGLNE